MPAYVIAEVTVTDLPAMEEYRKQVPATLAKYGGRFVVRAGTLSATGRVVAVGSPSSIVFR